MAALGLTIGGLAWLVFGVGEQHAGMQRLAEVRGAQVDYLTEAAPGLTREAVAALPGTAWRRWEAEGYLSVAHGSVIWLRVRLVNPGAEPLSGVLADSSYFSDRVDVWSLVRPGPVGHEREQTWRHALSGDAVPGAEKPLPSRTAVFPVTIPAGGEWLGYVRVSDGYVPHIQPMWWADAEDFYTAKLHSVLVECLCFGALLALVLYNFVLWLRLRFADTGYYVLTAGASAVCNLIANGVPALAGLPLGSPAHETLIAAAFAVGSFSMLQFARVFLGSRELLPRADRWLLRWRWLLGAVTLGVGAMPWMTTPAWMSVVAFAALGTDALCMIVAVAAWRRGAQHARFFVLAFGLLGVATLPAVASLMLGEVLPGTAFGLLAGRVLEMLLLSFAVADRFAQTQRRLVEETEQRRLIEETYAEELEIEVRERTRELAHANADKDRMLAVIGHDLRSPLTGLMRAADETPGKFAHDVSRTGRALLLLIEDLVLWARLRAGSYQPGEHPAAAVTAPAVALHHALAGQGGIELAVAVPAGLRVGTDLVLAQTLVRNLLANALKFAAARVELRAGAVAGNGVRFTVGNDGPPLPAPVAARFAAGEDEPLSATGGLGLRLCREICRALGTRLEAGTAAGGGTEFAFVLPAAPAEAPKP